MADLEELAGRVERAKGYDPALTKDIFRALFANSVPDTSAMTGYGWREDDRGWWCQTGSDQRTPPERIDPPKWLTSIDAAMALVPEGAKAMIESDLVHCRLTRKDWPWNGFAGFAGSMPLAITAAALRARTQGNPNG